MVLLLGGIVWGISAAAGPVAHAIVDYLPVSVDEKLGAAAGRMITGTARGTTEQQARVARLFSELMAAVPEVDRVAVATATIAVVADDAVNAYALPGGIVRVHTGLLAEVGDDDDALRGVLAHELGHAVHRHGMRQLVRSQLASFLLGWIAGDLQNLEGLAVSHGHELLSLSYSRGMEEESDDFALMLAAKGGWSAEGLARFFEALPDTNLGWWSTHPEPTARAARIRAKLAAAKR